jgi:hypothetical protein
MFLQVPLLIGKSIKLISITYRQKYLGRQHFRIAPSVIPLKSAINCFVRNSPKGYWAFHRQANVNLRHLHHRIPGGCLRLLCVFVRDPIGRARDVRDADFVKNAVEVSAAVAQIADFGANARR